MSSTSALVGSSLKWTQHSKSNSLLRSRLTRSIGKSVRSSEKLQQPEAIMTAVAKSILLSMLLASVVVSQESPFHSRDITVAASPSVTSELNVPSGTTVMDYDVWPTGPNLLILLRDASGSHVASWRVGSNGVVPVLDLPPGFQARSIAIHPRADRFFVSGESGKDWIILAVDRSIGKWMPRTIYRSPHELRRLLGRCARDYRRS